MSLCRRALVLALAAGVPALAPAWAGPGVTDATGKTVEIRDSSRIVSVAGALTEIVYALGAGDRLVGVDTTSLHPAATGALPKVGYQRTLSAEGILSLKPTLVLASEDAGPPAVIEHVARSGATVLRVSSHADPALVPARVRTIGKALGREDAAETLAKRIEAELADLRHRLGAATARPSVLFLLAVGQGAPMVAGRDTSADVMIGLAGGRNPVTRYTGYKPLSQEVVIAAAPDVILTTTQGLELVGGIDGLLSLPAFAATPAARARRVIALDALYLLGFGPRIGEAARDLAARLHPDPASR